MTNAVVTDAVFHSNTNELHIYNSRRRLVSKMDQIKWRTLLWIKKKKTNFTILRQTQRLCLPKKIVDNNRSQPSEISNIKLAFSTCEVINEK